ncbi:MAG: phosphatase PAP2 family protein [Gemmatimonadaceae bacterium]
MPRLLFDDIALLATRTSPITLPPLVTALATPFLAAAIALSPRVVIAQDIAQNIARSDQLADTVADRAAPVFTSVFTSAAVSARSDSASAHPRALFTARDAAVSAGVAAAVVALMPADRSIAHAFQRPGLQSNSGVKGALNVFNVLGDPGVIILSAGTYFLGLGTHSRPVAALGMHTGEAIVMSGVITEVLKGSFGRARPYVDVTKPHNFNFGNGFTSDDYASFPSGDVTLAFAAATAASREVAESWPGASRYVTPASYGAAALVGVARMYKNKHWASDVVAGAGAGTLSGVLFERYNRAYPNNVFNRVFLPASIVPERSGVLVAWSVPLQ